MLTNIVLFLVGAHLGAKYPKYATMLVDQAVAFAKGCNCCDCPQR